jgi:monofunctional glycosyltransferase
MRKVVRTTIRAFAIVLAIAFVYGIYIYLTLPDVRSLRTTNPTSTAFQELRERKARAKGHTPRRVQRWVSYGRISPNLTRAVLVTEDAKFWKHEGIDLDQIKESIEVNIERGEFARGASTITQQLAKNLYLSPSKTPVRKIRELLIARRLEAELTKQRILELYLNVIEWGDGIYGAEAAARTYFGKSAAELGPLEAALLAAVIANPRVLDAAHPSAKLRRRQQMIARRMGAVTPPPVVAATVPPPAQLPETPSLEPVPPLPASGVPAGLPGEVPAPTPEPAPKPCGNPPCR